MFPVDPRWTNIAPALRMVQSTDDALAGYRRQIEMESERQQAEYRAAYNAQEAERLRAWTAEVEATEARRVEQLRKAREEHAAAVEEWQQREAARERAHDLAVKSWHEKRADDRTLVFVQRIGIPVACAAVFAVAAVGMALPAAQVICAAVLGLVGGFVVVAITVSRPPGAPRAEAAPPEPDVAARQLPTTPRRPERSPFTPPSKRSPPSASTALWNEIRDRGGFGRGDSGDQGVAIVWASFERALDSAYLWIDGLMVRTRLDVDVLIVGPTGIWAFEVKFTNGLIRCQGGSWTQERTYFVAGGYEETEPPEPIDRPYDRQWQREVEALDRTLKRRLKPGAVGRDLPIRGGLIFTHPKGSWDLDDTCACGYGGPDAWAQEIRSAPRSVAFDLDNQCQVLDALLAHHQSIPDRGVKPTTADARAAAQKGINQARAGT